MIRRALATVAWACAMAALIPVAVLGHVLVRMAELMIPAVLWLAKQGDE